MGPFARGLFLAAICVLSGALSEPLTTEPDQTMDVLEAENVLLECRFSPDEVLSRGDKDKPLFFWIRTNRNGHDNVAIDETQLENNYSVEYSAAEGRYDLRISNATYDRDNGQYECRMKRRNSGETLHSKSLALTVLLKPSPPAIFPGEGATVSATEGTRLNLTCASSGGSPAPQIYWYRQGQAQLLDSELRRGANKDEPTTATLTIDPSKETDGAVFRCTVWNRALGNRQKLETSTKLDVKYFPRVSVGPSNPLKVERDDTAQLSCNVDAKPAVQSVKWTRNGRFINTHFKHTIPRVSLDDAGSYICSADNGLGQVTKAELTLDVQHAPIIALPARREVKAGESVVVDCKVTANPRITHVEWFKVGDDSFSQTGSVLRINRATAKDNGRYVCSATNFVEPAGKPRMQRVGNATIAINVHHKPGKAFITPSKPVAVDGRSVTLKCGADPPGYPAPRYRWWRRRSGDNSKSIAVGSKYTIDSVSLSSADEYFCQPSNDHGDGSVASTFLDVYQPPRVVKGLESEKTKRDGASGFQLTCEATGKPSPAVRWYKDGQVIPDKESALYQVSNSVQETSDGAFNVLSQLKFVGPERVNKEQLMPTDRGHYTCQFKNEISSAETKMLLRIQHAPVVVHQHNKVAFNEREAAYINCRMQAFPEPKFEWSFRGNPIASDRRSFETNRTALPGDIYESTLRIFRVRDSSYGDYTCQASNDMGPTKTKIRLQRKGKPEKPVDLRPEITSYNFITLGWDEGFDGGYDDTKFTIEYSQQGGGAPRYKDCGYDNPCNITSLEQHTQYYVRVKASNIMGESKWSEEAAVVTKVDVALIPKPANVHYEKSTGKASFQIDASPLSLVAKVELENGDGTWSHYDGLSLADAPDFAELAVDTPVVTNLRVRLCLRDNELLCGPYAEALIVDVRPNARTSAALASPWMIVVIVALLLLALAALLVLLRCFCCRGGKRMKSGGNVEANGRPTIVHHAPPSYSSTFTGGIDNKGAVDGNSVKDVSDDNLKAALFQNGYPASTSEHHQLQSGSNTNSANGGSVNSQDSLWNVKNGSPGATATTVLSSTSAATDPFYQNGYVPFDTVAMQQHQQQQQHQSFEDYTHYPYPDEYLNDGNRQYLAMNGDAGQPRNHSEYVPYGEMNGLPDPYTNGGMGFHPQQHLRHPQQQQQQQQLQHSSHIPSPHVHDHHQVGAGGDTPNNLQDSTPNSKSRRIIREIIV